MLRFSISVRVTDGTILDSTLTIFNSEQRSRHGVLDQLEGWRCRTELDRGVHGVSDGFLVESGRRVSWVLPPLLSCPSLILVTEAMDRIHRLGQHRPVRAVKIVIEDSIESRIIQLQEKKMAMVDATLSADDQAMGRLTPADVSSLALSAPA
jgi:hypothetical protein